MYTYYEITFTDSGETRYTKKLWVAEAYTQRNNGVYKTITAAELPDIGIWF